MNSDSEVTVIFGFFAQTGSGIGANAIHLPRF